MPEEKTFQELEVQAQTMVNVLTQQRNAAQDQCVMLMGQVAILEMRVAALTPKPAEPAQDQ